MCARCDISSVDHTPVTRRTFALNDIPKITGALHYSDAEVNVRTKEEMNKALHPYVSGKLPWPSVQSWPWQSASVRLNSAVRDLKAVPPTSHRGASCRLFKLAGPKVLEPQRRGGRLASMDQIPVGLASWPWRSPSLE